MKFSIKQLPALALVATIALSGVCNQANAQTLADAFNLDGISLNQAEKTAPALTAPRAKVAAKAALAAPAAKAPTVAEQFSVNSLLPSISVASQGPKSMTVGKESMYNVTVTNSGATTARGIEVTVSMPTKVQVRDSEPSVGTVREKSPKDGPYQMVWTIPAIAAKSQAKMNVNVTPKSGKAFDMQVRWSVSPSASTAHIDVREPKIAVSLMGPSDLVYGETAKVIATITNPGTGVAENVTFRSVTSANEAKMNPIGDIAPGQKRTVELNIPAKMAGKQSLRTTVLADLGLKAEQVHSYLVRRAKLQVKAIGPKLNYASTPANYAITVRNDGDADAKNVGVDIYLPKGITYVGQVPGVKATKTGLKWMVDVVRAKSERTFEMPCVLSEPGEQRILVDAVDVKQASKASGEVATVVRAVADLKLSVHDAPGPRPVGSETIYEIRVTNRGTKEARKINVAAICSKKLRLTDVSGNASINRETIKFQPIEVLPPGKTAIYQVKAKGVSAGSLPIHVTVDCSSPETQLVAQESTHFFDRGTSTASREANRR